MQVRVLSRVPFQGLIMTLTYIALTVLAVILVIGLFHFLYLYDAAKRIGYGKDAGRITFIALVSIFWPFTWIYYGVDRLRRGRVAQR